jgi:hypothetical protein
MYSSQIIITFVTSFDYISNVIAYVIKIIAYINTHIYNQNDT